MAYVLLIIAIIAIVAAHICKAYRWKQMISIYEKTKYEDLINSLSIGYIINYLLPYRIGDLARALYAGKKMKNGFSFSFATVILDRILDVIVVGILFIIFYLIGYKYKILLDSIFFYVAGSILLIAFLAISLKYNKYIKMTVKKVASIFNEKIELNILKLTWSFIQAFKDLLHNTNKWKILISTILMWALYLTSYGIFALSINNLGNNSNIVDVFMSFFSKNNLDATTFNAIQTYMTDFTKFTTAYILIPIAILVVISYILSKKKSMEQEKTECLELLPHSNPKDKLVFLEAYFSGEEKEYFRNYLKINRDITILQDFSAGSNATTMLCESNGKSFFRKYSFGDDSKKLYEQVKWIKKYKNDIPLTNITKECHEEGYCYYDMDYIPEAISCFNYIHSKPIKDTWNVLEKALDDLDKNLYVRNYKKAKQEEINTYINNKVIENLKKIEKSRYIKELLKYDKLIINGKEYHNLNYFKDYLNYEYLYNIFKDDKYSVIHGDLTVENIICMPNNTYYLIDPNTGNIHDSPNLDYAKLLQSLHGCYEFLMNIKNINIDGDSINYLNTESLSYKKIYNQYDEYLNKKFSKEQVKSIYFHEIVHWIRLLPYKIKKDDRMAVLFFCGFIIIMNDIIEKYGGNINEK